METDVNGNSLTDFMEQLDWASLTQADQVRLIKVYEKSVEIHQTGLKKANSSDGSGGRQVTS